MIGPWHPFESLPTPCFGEWKSYGVQNTEYKADLIRVYHLPGSTARAAKENNIEDGHLTECSAHIQSISRAGGCFGTWCKGKRASLIHRRKSHLSRLSTHRLETRRVPASNCDRIASFQANRSGTFLEQQLTGWFPLSWKLFDLAWSLWSPPAYYYCCCQCHVQF